MKQVWAIIRNEKWQATRLATEAVGFEEQIHSRVLGRGRQRGLRYLRRASDSGDGDMPFLPKRMAVYFVADERCDALVNAILKVNQSGNVGDGKVFVLPVNLVDATAPGEVERKPAPATA